MFCTVPEHTTLTTCFMMIVDWQVMLPWRQTDDSSRVQYRLSSYYFTTLLLLQTDFWMKSVPVFGSWRVWISDPARSWVVHVIRFRELSPGHSLALLSKHQAALKREFPSTEQFTGDYSDQEVVTETLILISLVKPSMIFTEVCETPKHSVFRCKYKRSHTTH